jgi:hypothetical protein
MAETTLFASADLDLLENPARCLQVRVFAPTWNEVRRAWACRIEIDPPINMQQSVYGESGIQALTLAIKILASALYGSKLYRDGQLGAFGEFGTYLGIPAPKESLEHAPYPF